MKFKKLCPRCSVFVFLLMACRLCLGRVLRILRIKKSVVTKLNPRAAAIGGCILLLICSGAFAVHLKLSREYDSDEIASLEAPEATPGEFPGSEAISALGTEGNMTKQPGNDENASKPKPEIVIHAVQAGETLWDIADHYRTTVVTIASLNGLDNPNRLSIGQNLTILTNTEGLVHRVKQGDTLWDIATTYKVPAGKIIEANDLQDIDNLRVGTQLIIPGAKPTMPTEVRVASRNVSGRFIWPSKGSITSHFGSRWGRLHEGLDIEGKIGDPVVASRGGQVTFAGWRGTYGKLVIIDCGSGISNYYGHLSEIAVSAGETVSQGELIGRVGDTGRSTGPHLHFEVRIGGKPKNPLDYLP